MTLPTHPRATATMMVDVYVDLIGDIFDGDEACGPNVENLDIEALRFGTISASTPVKSEHYDLLLGVDKEAAQQIKANFLAFLGFDADELLMSEVGE